MAGTFPTLDLSITKRSPPRAVLKMTGEPVDVLFHSKPLQPVALRAQVNQRNFFHPIYFLFFSFLAEIAPGMESPHGSLAGDSDLRKASWLSPGLDVN